MSIILIPRQRSKEADRLTYFTSVVPEHEKVSVTGIGIWTKRGKRIASVDEPVNCVYASYEGKPILIYRGTVYDIKNPPEYWVEAEGLHAFMRATKYAETKKGAKIGRIKTKKLGLCVTEKKGKSAIYVLHDRWGGHYLKMPIGFGLRLAKNLGWTKLVEPVELRT